MFSNSTRIIVIQIVDLNGILLSWWTLFFYCVCVFLMCFTHCTPHKRFYFFLLFIETTFLCFVWLKFNVPDSLNRYFWTIFKLLTGIPKNKKKKIIYTYLEKRFKFIGIFVFVCLSSVSCLLCSDREISPVSPERVCSQCDCRCFVFVLLPLLLFQNLCILN